VTTGLGASLRKAAVARVKGSIAALKQGKHQMSEDTNVGKFTGFTLFETKGGWQLSYRERGETGWNVHSGLQPEVAQRFLDIIAGVGWNYTLKSASLQTDDRQKLRKWLELQERLVEENTAAREGYHG
jgi:glycine cleavage system aminomethyltransferase T